MSVPTYPYPLFITDAAINIVPDLTTKIDIVQNAIDLHLGLGLGEPRVAILAAVETVNPKMPTTLDAAALCKMADRGQIKGGVLDGPLALDNAISPEAARIKGIDSPVAGRAQILVVPDLEAGNMLAKNLSFMANADAAGIVLGARVPIILTSRADDVRTRIASCAVAALYAHNRAPQRRGGGVTAMADTLLVVNAGSSSIKFQLFEVAAGDRLELEFRGQMEGIGTQPHLIAKDAAGAELVDASFEPAEVGDVPAALDQLDDWLIAQLGGAGADARSATASSMAAPTTARRRWSTTPCSTGCEQLVPLAPLHQPNNLAPIREIRARYPQIPQVACFDTAFHRGHPEVADRYAIAERWYSGGRAPLRLPRPVLRVCRRPAARARPGAGRRARVVVCHLGSGASMCAIHGGRSMDSTMGFTAVDGLPMGTRTGQLDPGVILYLIQNQGFDADARSSASSTTRAASRACPGVSNDMRDLLASDAPGARLAIDYFVYRIVRETGALAAAMGGIDGLVFTAGIGEHSARPRARGRAPGLARRRAGRGRQRRRRR